MKIAFLIPTTTSQTKFKKLDDTYLYRFCLKSILNTISLEHKYTIYYAIDDDDILYKKLATRKRLINVNEYKKCRPGLKINIKIISTKGIKKGNVVAYWNKLFKIAYDEGNDYFVQLGDDILFHDKNWLDICIYQLNLNMNIGVASPIDIGNRELMTQSVVSRKHMEIFGYYYPNELISWFCDNWITDIYKKDWLMFNRTRLENKGGKPRYTPPDWETTKKLCSELVERDLPKLKDYINCCV
tara:strand:+ start:2253 stop:2978 length:726 start_codon:yes stop_codon:yes gene_type:complete